MTTTTNTHEVQVIGPNLRGDCETFHVHAAGCADVARNYGRGKKLGGEVGPVETFATVADLISCVYADMIAEAGDTWEDYTGEFRFFPCTGIR